MHCKSLIHRMRLPTKEDNRLVLPDHTINRTQHSLFAAFYKVELRKSEKIMLDRIQREQISGITRFKSVDLVIKSWSPFFQILKTLQALFPSVLRNSKREMTTGKIDCNLLYRTICKKRLNGSHASRIPVAQKDVNLVIAH